MREEMVPTPTKDTRKGERGSALVIALICLVALFVITIGVAKVRVANARDIEDRNAQAVQYWQARAAAANIQASLIVDIPQAFDTDLQRSQIAANGYPLPAFDQPNVLAQNSLPVLNSDGSISNRSASQCTSLLGNLDAWAARNTSIAETFATNHGYGTDKARVAVLKEYQRQQLVGVGGSEPAYVLQYMIDAAVGEMGNVRGRVRPSGTIMLGPAQPACNTTAALAANPPTISLGNSTTLTVTYTNANHVWLTDQTGAVVSGTDTNGLIETNSPQTISFTVSPTDDSSYRAVAQSSSGCQAISAIVTVVVQYPPPVILAFDATPSCINRGEATTLSFTVQYASTITLTGGGVNQSVSGNGTGTTSGSFTVSPTVDTTFTLTASGKGGTSSRNVLVTVKQPITINTFVSDTYCLVSPANTVNLTWAASNAESATVTDNSTEIVTGVNASGGTRSFSVTGPTSFTLTVSRTGCDGTPDVATQTININTSDLPTATFSANPSTIQVGSSTLLQWTTTNTNDNSTVTISASPAAGSGVTSPQTVTTNGTLWIQPTAANSYTYTLSVANNGCSTQSTSKTTTLLVTNTPVPPACPNLQSFDGDSCIVAGNSATLRWNVANADFVDITGPGVSRTFSANPNGTGSFSVSPTSDTTYTLTARTNATGPQPITWQAIVGATANANNLTKPGGAGWDAGATSAQAIVSGDGYVEFTASETTTYRMLGLSNGDSNQSYTDIDFALYPAADGGLYIYESGNYRGYFGGYSNGDLLRVSIEGGAVKYKRNGSLLYSSAIAPTYPLLVDTSLYSTGATLNNVVISGNIQTTNQAPTSGLIAYWNFDEGSGTTATDGSGNSHTGYLYNSATWTAAKVGSAAINFDGSSGLLGINVDDFAIQNSFSYSFWANPTLAHTIDSESTGGYAGYFNTHRYLIDPSWYEAGEVGAGLSVATNGVTVIENGDNDMAPVLVYNAPISGWTQVTVVYQNKQPKLYINGALVRTGLTSRNNVVHFTPDYLGGGFYGYYGGAVDDFRVYNRALSATEIQTLSGSAGTGAQSCTPASPPSPTTATFTVHVGQRPSVSNLVATPGSIDTGQSTRLTWANSANVASVSVIGGGGDPNTYSVPSSQGYLDVRPPSTSTYTVVATSNDCDRQTASQAVSVTVSPCPSITSPFTGSPTSIFQGQSATLQWGLANAAQALINGGAVPTSGSLSVSPAVSTTYTLTAVSANGSCSFNQSVTINVLPCPSPAINSFVATPSSVVTGGTANVTLSWSVADSSGTGVTITIPGVGSWSAATGSVTFTQPQSTTTYTLQARSGCGATSTAQTTVTVNPCPPPTINSFSATPNAVTQGGTATVRLAWNITDASGNGLSITITGVGSFTNPNGFVDIPQPQSNTTYTLTVTGDNSQPVNWTNPSAVATSGNSLTATGGSWNAGAVSAQTISSGNGYVQTTIAETNTYRMVGLGNGDSNYSYTDIEYAWYPAADGVLYIYESGSYIGSFGVYATGDVLRVAVEAGVIKYEKNGVVLHTSTQTPSYPLLVDTSFYSPGSTLNNVRISTSGSCGPSSSAQTTVSVSPCPPPTINTFTASPNAVTIGGSSTVRLSWSVTDPSGTGVTITIPGIGTWTTTTGFVDIAQPQTTSTYTLQASAGCGGQSSATTTVTASPCPPPTINAFTASPSSVIAGGNTLVRLQWSITDSYGAGITISIPGVGTFSNPNGFVDISQPGSTTTYTLTATSACGSPSSAQTTVTVLACPPPTITSFTANPSSVLIGGHQTVRLSWSISDPSGTGVTVSIPGVGTFANPNGFVDIAQPQNTTSYQVITTAGCGAQSSSFTTVVATACPPPNIQAFTATPSSVTIGGSQTVRLAWSVADSSGTGVTVTIPGVGTFGATGSIDISQPQSTTTYQLIATAGCGAQSIATVTVTAAACPAPTIISFVANPPSVTIGGGITVRLSWNVADTSGTGVGVNISGIGNFGPTGFIDIPQPQATTTYTLTATSGCGAVATAQATVTASSCPAPIINAFFATPSSVRIGGNQTVTFSWSVTDTYGSGVSVTISGVGTFFSATGTASIPQPQATTTYNLHVTNGCGSANDASLTITASPQTVDFPQPEQGPFSYFCPSETAHEFVYSVAGTIELTRDGDYVIVGFTPSLAGTFQEAQAVWWGGAVINGVTLRSNTPGVTGDFFIFHSSQQFNITSYRFYSPPGTPIVMTLYADVGGEDCTDEVPVGHIPFDATFPTF